MPVEKSSDGAMKKVLQDIDTYSDHSKRIKDTDKAFLKVIMDSPVIQSLAKAHGTLASCQFFCITKAASDIVKQVLRETELIEDVQIQELYHLLQNPHMLNVIAAHDAIAKQNFFPLQYVNEPPEAFDPEEYAVRMIGLYKRPGESLGLTVSIQNEEVVVSRILHDGLVHKQGLLHVGDIIKEINGQEIKGDLDVLKKCLSKSNDSYTFKIIPSYKQRCNPDSVFVKCNFAFDPVDDSYIPSKDAGLSFNQNDILRIVNRDDMQWWQAQKVNESGESYGRAGLIPSSELEERRRILISHASNKSTIDTKKEVCKMYRLSDYYNEYTDDYLLYEEVALLPPFLRKCIVLLSHDSSVANQVKSKLVETYPEFYKAPVTHTTSGTKKEHYEFVSKETMMQDIKDNKYFEFTEIKGDLFGTRYDSVQNVMKSVKSCVKDVALKNVKFLLTSEFMPYVIFLKPESDIVECSAHCINLTLTHHSIEESCSHIHLNMRELSKKPQWVPFLNLHPEHLPFVLSHHPESCTERASCPFKNGSCWGYERDCKDNLRYGKPPTGCKSNYWKHEFQTRVDFDYVKERRNETMKLCKSKESTDSYLHCSRYTRFCIGQNIYMDLKALLHSDGRDKYREDVFNEGDIGGFCQLDKTLLQKQYEHKSPLQSWYAELQNFTKLPFNPLLETNHCDVVINHPVVLMKLDYGGNMFHHFCDFFNLYVSQHLNNSWFGQDLHIIMWDTATSHYFDLFSSSWKVFTKHPVTALMDLKGKRVCFREAMFSLLPRMRSGMFYNTYVPDSCVGSNLFRAFSEHFLYRMNITQNGPIHVGGKPIVRLTLLQRGNPNKEDVFRQIKNQSQLVKSLEYFDNVDVKVVEYDWKRISFEDQLSITHNTDIFIGMHGAGLAHFLFLPKWAVAVELYNCGDSHCYSDLARLRGLHYLTWPQDAPAPKSYDQGKHKMYGDNPKFWNWKFDVGTFKSLVAKARNIVLNNPAYQLSLRAKDNGIKREEL